jgi:c-di-GMP-binding flagellar brake protein YcgR
MTAKVTRLIIGGKEGRLTTSGGQPVPVRVYDRDPDLLTLVLMLDDGEELGTCVEPLVVEYASTQGLVRFRGTAVLEQRDLVRFQVSTEAEVVQRRDFVRVEAVQPVMLAAGESDALLGTHALDISGGGMLLSGPETLELEATVRFSLHLDTDGPPLEGQARVVRAAGDGRLGLVFDQISRTDRQRLIHFIFERQRAALARRIG